MLKKAGRAHRAAREENRKAVIRCFAFRFQEALRARRVTKAGFDERIGYVRGVSAARRLLESETLPCVDRLVLVARILDTTPNYLLGFTTQMDP